MVVSYIQNPLLCLRIVLVCGISIVLVTFLRKKLNLPRPKGEEQMYNKKEGEAFPSRHTFSLAIIALSWLNVNVIVGAILFGLSVVLGTLRVVMSAHFPRDIIGAILIAITCACAGYLIF